MNKQHFQAHFKAVAAKEASEAANEIEGVVIHGYASTPDLDRDRDVVQPEAFRKTIVQDYRKNPIILFQHNPNRPIGKATSMSIDNKGLFIEAVIVDKELEPKIRAGILKTFSIGYIVKESKFTDGNGVELNPDIREDRERIIFDPEVKRVITELELYENSIVSVPANPSATFDVSKSLKSYFDDQMYEKILSENDGVISYQGEKGMIKFPLSEGWTKRNVKRWLEFNHKTLPSLTDTTMKRKNLLEAKSEEENVEANNEENEEQTSEETNKESVAEAAEGAGDEPTEESTNDKTKEGESEVETTSEPAKADEATETPTDEKGGEGEGNETGAEGAETVEGDTETGAEKSWTPEHQTLATKAISQLSKENEELKAQVVKLKGEPGKKSLVYSKHAVNPQEAKSTPVEKEEKGLAGEKKTGFKDAFMGSAN